MILFYFKLCLAAIIFKKNEARRYTYHIRGPSAGVPTFCTIQSPALFDCRNCAIILHPLLSLRHTSCMPAGFRRAFTCLTKELKHLYATL